MKQFLLSITPDGCVCQEPENFIIDELGTFHRFLNADTILDAVKESAQYEKLFKDSAFASISAYIPAKIAPVQVTSENKTVYMDVLRKSRGIEDWIPSAQAWLTNDYIITIYNKKDKTFTQI